MPSTAPEVIVPDYSGYLHVAAAVIENQVGEVLIARRHDHLHQGGLWEFPGGKVEQREDSFAALQRELREELGIAAETAHPLIRIPYCYPDRKVLLSVWRVTGFAGEPHGVEGQAIKWVNKERLKHYQFPAANQSIISAAQLPSTYLITPDPGSESLWPEFLRHLEASLRSGVTLLQFRAHSLNAKNYLKLAREMVALSHQHNARVLLNADTSLMEQCDADGIHLNSHRLMAMDARSLVKDKLLAASCHNLAELRHAEAIGADFAVLSPVKSTASHPDVSAFGWQKFSALSEGCGIPLYALGGLGKDDLPDAWRNGAQGIAAIRALWA